MRQNRRKPDKETRIEVEGGEVVAYTFGNSDEALLLLHGGPAVRSDHLQHTHAWLADHDYSVVIFDQLGAGKSDRPDNTALWTIERYAREVETVREALGLKHFQLFGHSWGAMLAIEYVLSFPDAVKSIVIAHGIANCPFHRQEVERLLSAFGPEFLRMRRNHEINGTTSHSEYEASETLMWRRHVCRMLEWPEEMEAFQQDWYTQPYETMFGSEYRITGNLRDWNRIPDMARIEQPVLILTGEHDALTPGESLQMHETLPNSRIHMFRDIAHMPFYECPEEYGTVIKTFFDEQREG